MDSVPVPKRLRTSALPHSQSSVMQRLAAFLPQMAEANKELQERELGEGDHIDGQLESCPEVSCRSRVR